MRLATLQVQDPKTVSERRDGRLVVVSQDGAKAAPAPARFPNLLAAIQEWDAAEPALRALAAQVDAGSAPGLFDLAGKTLMAPLPRTFAWLDGSAFIQHIVLVRKARGAEPPEDLKTVPLMYQGVSDDLLGPEAEVPLIDFRHGMDFEAEVAVILDEVPMGTKAADAAKHIKLICLMNDVSLRGLIPRELAAGFGFFHGKPASTFSPFAATPDELGEAWKDTRVHLEMKTVLNGELYGHPNAGEMFFGFDRLIEHAAATRKLTAGTILGSGTVSNDDESVGSSCLAEKRMLEKIKTGKSTTPFMKEGDVIEIEMEHAGRSVFGRIRNTIVAAAVPA